MNYYDGYVARMNQYGETDRDTLINLTKVDLAESFKDSPSYYQVNWNSSLLDCQILDSNDGTDAKQFLCLFDNQIRLGHLITWKNINWLITYIDEMSEIYKRATIRRANSKLRWLDLDGEIKETYYVLDVAARTNFGVQDGRYLTVGNERRNLIVPANSDTQILNRQSRFILEDRAWIIAASNSLASDGLIYLTLDETQINDAEDNLDIGIANYNGHVADYKIAISNGTSFSIRAGLTLQLNVNVTNRDIDVVKPLLYSTSNPSIATVSETGLITTIANGTCTISVELVEHPEIKASINGTVQLAVQDNYTVELIEELILTKNSTRTFTAVVKNNGIVDPSKFVYWDVFADDMTNTTNLVTVISSSTTQISLKGNASGYVQLRTRVIGISGYHWIRVQVKGLI